MRTSRIVRGLLVLLGWAATVHAADTLTLPPTPSSLYPNTVLADNPVAYFRLTEPAGSPTITSQVGAFTGSVIGGVTLGTVPGPLAFGGETAAQFNGTTGKIDVPYSPALNTSAWTIEAWARVTGGSGHRSPVTSRPPGYIFYATPSNVWEYWSGPTWHVQTGPAVVNDEWVHLVGTFDPAVAGGTKNFYVNGVLVDTDTGIAATPNLSSPFRIGAGATEGAGQFFFQGDVAEVAYYNYALDQSQILAHFDAAALAAPVPLTPEPHSAALMTLGMVLCGGWFAWRRRRVA